MSTLSVLRYPLDLTGVSPDNFVSQEPHALPARPLRAFVTTYGPFFTESMVVYDAATNKPLTKGVQYVAAQLIEKATVRSGKEVCSIVVITDPNVSANVLIDYQVIGGQYSLSVEVLQQLIDALNLDQRPVAWAEILEKPLMFPPGHHLHDIGDIYGFEYMVYALEDIRQAILMGDQASHDAIYDYIELVRQALLKTVNDSVAAMTAHISNTNNPHQTTKDQVGLGNVGNFGMAAQSDAEAGASNTLYMSPLGTQQNVAKNLIPINAHIANMNNPHQTTKAQVGLSLVQNYDIATDQEAMQGLVNNKYMTPFKTVLQIGAQVGNPLAAHLANMNNPHQTTKAQVGLGNVQNFGMASQADAEAAQSASVYMSPLTTGQAIDKIAISAINAHASRLDNPHQTNKAQIGLGSVDNFRTSNWNDAVAGTGQDSFMTPQTVNWAIQQFALTRANMATDLEYNGWILIPTAVPYLHTVLQWGHVSVPNGDGQALFTYPLALTGVGCIVTSPEGIQGGGSVDWWGIVNPTTYNCYVTNKYDSWENAHIFIVGWLWTANP